MKIASLTPKQWASGQLVQIKPKLRGWLHLAAAPLSLAASIVLVCLAPTTPTKIGSAVYLACSLILFGVSATYHRFYWAPRWETAWRRMDHSNIFLLIAGTYTPILLSAVRPLYPALAWTAFGVEWGLTALAVTLTAIDLRQFRVFSMVCYIVMGWGVAAFFPETVAAMTETGFYLLLSGGVCYTAGAVLYGIGAKRRYFHCAFHVFVLLGSVLHFLAVYLFAL